MDMRETRDALPLSYDYNMDRSHNEFKSHREAYSYPWRLQQHKLSINKARIHGLYQIVSVAVFLISTVGKQELP